MRFLVAGVLLSSGCGPSIDDPEGFAREFAGIWCEQQETCALGDFERDYDSREDCFDDRSADPHIHDSDKSGCSIDPEAADDCLSFMADAECADWKDGEIEKACEDVYVDCD
jgi:hypothetical protein